MKHCNFCNRTLLIECFSVCSSAKDGRLHRCKQCQAKYTADYNKKNYDKLLAYRQDYWLKTRHKRLRPSRPKPVLYDESGAFIKLCPKCGMILPWYDFHYSSSRKDGLSHVCKQCVNAVTMKYYFDHKSEIKQRTSAHYAKNKEQIRAKNKEWLNKNRHVEAARIAKRRATKINATPVWVDTEALKAIYEASKAKTQETGVKYVVDHIVPLVHKDVCGLHVPWNLRIITYSENAHKSNNFTPGFQDW